MRRLVVASLVLGLASRGLAGQESTRELHFDLLVGTAWNLPTPLTIRLPGEATVRHRARYSTRPWSDAPYYAYRVGGGSTQSGAPSGYELELVHHKLYLEDPRPPIEHFEVTHGYNLVTANAVRPADRFTIRFGIGVVVAHAEGRIAGEHVGGVRRTFLGGGYHIAGLTAQIAAGRRYPLGRGRVALYALPEAKLTASTARVPLGDAGGGVIVPNVAVHVLAGLGVRRLPPR